MNSAAAFPPGALYPKLRRVNREARDDHHYLSSADECWYLGLYRPGARNWPLNRLILQFKCPPTQAARQARAGHSKRAAISAIALALRAAVPRRCAEAMTWVPIPTSADSADPDYDERLLETLVLAFEGYDLDVRPLLRLGCSTGADHRGHVRLALDTLRGLLSVDEAALARAPLRARIMLFDDLLTSGKHYRCCEQRLRACLQDVPISGCFIARRVLRSRWWRCADDAAADPGASLG
jgi:hypothetical protein